MENKYSRKYIIGTGIGLQDVDHLKNSSYFINQSERYIRGEINLDELEQIITSYYKQKPDEEERSEEADIISVRIGQIISEDSFSFSVGQLVSIHHRLFEGVFPHAGKIREYNFNKPEWVLSGGSVFYGDYRELEMTLDYDFSLERKCDYSKLTMDETIEHLADFVSNLWQIHPFEEGNTRTTAVFFIKYLRSLGFDVTNNLFEKNAYYFRNALVRANFRYIAKGIYDDKSFLIKFLRNLLLGENNPLKNKEMLATPVNKNKTPQENKESRVLALIKNNPQIKAVEIANQVGVSERTVKSILAVLVEQKKIVRINGKRYGYWQIDE